MKTVSLAIALLASVLGHSRGFAEYTNVVPIGWVSKSHVFCKVPSDNGNSADNICRINLPNNEALSIFSLPNNKVLIAQIRDLTPVEKLDEK
jgi:hypothetical protein